MTVRLSQKTGISAKTLWIDDVDIENQAMQDLAQYRALCAAAGHPVDIKDPLDVDHFVELVFDIEAEPTPIKQTPGTEKLGYYDPINKKIVYDPEVCNSEGRISFTVAHEAGHVRLHTCLVAGKDPKRWEELHKYKNIEYQADAYAAFLLAPTQSVVELLREENYVEFGTVVGVVDMQTFAPKMMDRFGLSWHASEIRLKRMGVTMTGRNYD